MFHVCFHYTGLLGIGTVSSVSARLSYNGSRVNGSINHTETMELSLAQETTQSWPSFGIILGKQHNDFVGEDELEGNEGTSLIVGHIEKGSPADKCGILQPGDRILCIDDWHTADGTLEEASHLLRILSLSGSRSVTLLVEFNVIEPVLPPAHGSFFVMRLAKCGKCLGIVCQSHQNGTTKGEPLIISHIRIGSVAHRCGSIQVGDQIHSIDDIPLDTCTLDEAMRLLQRSARIVKLVIIKGGGQEQHLLESPQSFVYTVELLRRGRPLGITIASAGGALDPIIISKLAPNGLAERTGALNIGDQIIAVNGELLEGKKVSQITQILQQCPDPISLKLSRPIAPNIDIKLPSTDPIFSTYSDPYSNGGGNGGLDSGLSSAAATDSQPGGIQSSSQTKCCECQFEIDGSGTHSFCCSNSPNSSSERKGRKEENDNEWMRILEALEVVSEAEMLRKLEECILNGSASNYVPSNNKSRYGFQQMFPSELGNILSHQQLVSTNNNYDVVDNINQFVDKQTQEIFPSQERHKKYVVANHSRSGTPTLMRSQQQQQNGELPPAMPSPRISTTDPPPFTIAASSTFTSSQKSISTNSLPSCTINNLKQENEIDEFSEVFSVQLKRCPLTKNFGFSVCDGLIGEENEIIEELDEKNTIQLTPTGIYIRSLVKDGPAEKCGRIQPRDRILQQKRLELLEDHYEKSLNDFERAKNDLDVLDKHLEFNGNLLQSFSSSSSLQTDVLTPLEQHQLIRTNDNISKMCTKLETRIRQIRTQQELHDGKN
uniref:PDZ domain-containing protein n=1 Tax=Meloidogyne javanica TaxID=6303 RepID=A0A915MFB6_MELJA